jgi:uncharacterized protein YqgC (DUF456 family)
MVDILLLIIGIIFLFVGLAGCVLPVIPGPPLSYLGLLMLHFTSKYQFSNEFLLVWAAIVVVVTVIENLIPLWGTKKFGGSKRAVWGSLIGLLAGLFLFPPFGIIICPFIGAVVAELTTGKNSTDALRAGFGAFLGFIGGTILKLITSGVMIFYFFKEIVAAI